jgi:hypothetical protein
MTCAALFASSVQAQVLPPPFENMTHIVCVDQKMAIELLTAYVEDSAFGEEFLAHLATRGICERTTFSGKPVTDMYAGRKHPTGELRKMHVFEVDVTSSEVLKGRTRVYMLMYVMHDNEAKRQQPTLKQRALSVGPCLLVEPSLSPPMLPVEGLTSGTTGAWRVFLPPRPSCVGLRRCCHMTT